MSATRSAQQRRPAAPPVMASRDTLAATFRHPALTINLWSADLALARRMLSITRVTRYPCRI
jgi:hypothetical protein